MGEDIIDIIDRINTTLSNIEGMGIPPKFKGDKLHAKEFNSVVNKIEEIKTHLNSPIKDTIVDTTAYLLDKIGKVRENLNANTIMMDANSSTSIHSELDSIRHALYHNEENIVQHTADISYVNTKINDIAESLGFVTNEIETTYNSIKEYADEVSETAYTRAVESSKEYTDESYTRLYTHITDTTLTFDYDIKTDPEPAQPKIIYDNEEDLYDGEYHD